MIRLLTALIVLAAFTGKSFAEGPLTSVVNDEGVLISAGDLPVLRYQRSVKSLDGKFPRCNYVHPLFDLDGNEITEDFPADHKHHRGVFWAWHQVSVGDKQLGDAWTCKDFVWDVRNLRTSGDENSQSMVATVVWMSPDHVDDVGQMIPVVQELTTITVHRADEDYRAVDFTVSLRALVDDVKIGGSDDVKGYGGFSPRIKLNQNQRFISASGVAEPIKTAIEAGNWINITHPSSGIAILSHNSNPPPNNRWILRAARSMQNAVYPGRQPVAVSKTEPTILRYRLVIHRGDLTAGKITKLHAEFSK